MGSVTSMNPQYNRVDVGVTTASKRYIDDKERHAIATEICGLTHVGRSLSSEARKIAVGFIYLGLEAYNHNDIPSLLDKFHRDIDDTGGLHVGFTYSRNQKQRVKKNARKAKALPANKMG